MNERGRCTAGSLELDGGAESIGTAREHARRFLLTAEPSISDRTVADVLLAVSELVTNAVLHAPGPCTLEVALDEQADEQSAGRPDERYVRIAVTDSSGVAPVPRAPDRNGSGGLGLHMLQALAGGVETRLHEGGDGKTVHVRVPVAPRGGRQKFGGSAGSAGSGGDGGGDGGSEGGRRRLLP